MAESVLPAVVILASFLVGSIPWGLLVARWVAGVDVRKVGSGNVGATNVSRVLGRKWFFVVFVLDAAKAVLPVVLLPGLAGGAEWLRVACGLAAVLGHVFNPFLGFKGGKGVATSAGAVFALAPLPAAAATAVFGLVLLAFRYVSLASISSAVAMAPLALLFGAPREVVLLGVVVAIVVVVRHAANLGRIAAGTEPRVFAKKETAGG